MTARIFLRILKSVLFWEYDRDTWQYDVLAAIILVLIFFSPRGHSQSRIHQQHVLDVVIQELPAGQPTRDLPSAKKTDPSQ